jgi:hypothetical protein
MFCELNESEIYDAYLLYASLHGFSTDESTVRQRVESYCRQNVPDEVIDDAIFAYTENSFVAPPDVVLEPWGRSRIYELDALPCGGWRHQVCSSWLENGCEFQSGLSVRLAHFWTSFACAPEQAANVQAGKLQIGTRLKFECVESEIQVVHRVLGVLGNLPPSLAEEIIDRSRLDIRYLPIVDLIELSEPGFVCKLLVCLAEPNVVTSELVDYTTNAFQALRKKC